MGKEIKIKNTLECKMVIREGNGGVYRQLAVVAPRKDYTLKIDPNATYREYVLITLAPENIELPPLSSDDIIEFKEIVVKVNPEWKQGSLFPYHWEGDPVYVDPKSKKDSKKPETAIDCNHGDGHQLDGNSAADAEKTGFWRGLLPKGLPGFFNKSKA